MKRLIILVTELTVLFSLCVIGTRLIGMSDKKETFAAVVRGDAQFVNGIWCWKLICPDVTTLTNARQIIIGSGGKLTINLQDDLTAEFVDGYTASVDTMPDSAGKVIFIRLKYVPTLQPIDTLADALLNFGSPQVVRLPTSAYSFRRCSVCFENHLCIYLSGFQGRFDPFLKLDDIEFQSSDADRYLVYQAWKGFAYYPPQ